MSLRPTPFAVDEWYHCFNRGVEKRITFNDNFDYDRFVQLLHLANSTESFHRSNILVHTTPGIMEVPISDRLVSIAAYCLMPNHFHLLIKEIRDDGISTFMQKLGTAYTMYFNARNKRVGGLFVKPFRSRHISTDEYLQHCARYIHCNPIELRDPKWKQGEVKNMNQLQNFIESYRYSSLPDYTRSDRPERALLGVDGFETFEQVSLRAILEDAQEYYRAAEAAKLFV